MSEGGEFAHHGGVKRIKADLENWSEYIYIAHWSGRAQAEERPWTVGLLTDSKKKRN